MEKAEEQKKIAGLSSYVYLSALMWVLLLGIPRFIHFQPVTGPLVNAVLLIATVVLGLPQAILMGIVPSSIALAAGLLPMTLFPLIPFIILSNFVLVITFNYLYKKTYTGGVASAAVLKFIFLQLALLLVIAIKPAIAGPATLMVSWPQLATALVGGLIAFPVLTLKKI